MKKILLNFSFFIILGLVILVVFLNRFSNSTKFKKNTPRGRLYFQSENYYTAEAEDTINVVVIADSVDNAVVGYDLDLVYDSNNVQLVNITNLNENQFDFFYKEKTNEILITGMKKINLQEKIYFKKTALTKISFKPINKTNTYIKFIFNQESKKESNLITEKNIDILDEVQNCQIFFGKKINIKLNVPLNYKNLSLTLIDVDKPKTGCLDCFETATLSVKKDHQEKKIKFKSGGYAGVIIDSLKAFEYQFILKSIESNEIFVSIYEI